MITPAFVHARRRRTLAARHHALRPFARFTDDPRLKFVKAGALASRWGSRFEGYANVGHINAKSGLGAWPAGFALLRDLAERAASAGTLAPTARAA